MDLGGFLGSMVRPVPDFPKPGIIFQDITPLIADPMGFDMLIEEMAGQLDPIGNKISTIVGIESRGFIIGAALANKIAAGFVPVRKPGKLPYKTIRDEYELEYGKGILEINDESLEGKNVVIVDDLLATGGTARCAARLCEKVGANVFGYAFAIELTKLKGIETLGDKKVVSIILA